MYNREFTPGRITELKPNEIFVFGSNLAGAHAGGAARIACRCFGAVWGQGVGLQGQSYAIPTMQGGVKTIKPYVDEFIDFAKNHSEYKFLVTPIGCGIAGFTPNQIAPLFFGAMNIENVLLPRSFVQVLSRYTELSSNAEHTWDSEKDFLATYRTLIANMKQGNHSAYPKVKELRIKEFQNTVDIVNQGHYVTENGTRYTFPDDTDMIEGTLYYRDEMRLEEKPQGTETTIVEVKNMDCLEAGVKLKEQGYNPAVLNMASRQNPAASVQIGIML